MAVGTGTRSELWRRALDLIPGGVNSPVRAMRAVGLDEPLFVRRGSGAELETTDGRRYLDWVMSWGPLLFGHADPETLEAVVEAARDGTSFGAPTEREVELAAEIVDAVPSVEKVRLVSSGTEAAQSAIRLARGFTRRDRILKFAGCYHGHVDALLADAGSGVATLGIPASPGVPTAVTSHTIVCPYNDADAAAAAVARYGEGLARDHRRAGRREHGRRPARARVPGGAAGALRRLRRAADPRRGDHRLPRRARRRAGALRHPRRPDHPREDPRRRAADRGVRRARGRDGPARAGGRRLPGRDAVREPARDRGGALGAAAAARPARLRRARAARRRARGGSRAVRPRAARRLDAHALRRPRRAGARLRGRAARSDTERYAALFRHLLERGIYVAPSQFECLFVSLAHGDREIERTVEAVGDFFGRD